MIVIMVWTFQSRCRMNSPLRTDISHIAISLHVCTTLTSMKFKFDMVRSNQYICHSEVQTESWKTEYWIGFMMHFYLTQSYFTVEIKCSNQTESWNIQCSLFTITQYNDILIMILLIMILFQNPNCYTQLGCQDKVPQCTHSPRGLVP